MFKNLRRLSKIKKTEYTLDDFIKVFTVTLSRRTTENDLVSDNPFHESYRVELLGWREMFGVGNTPLDAYESLKVSFEDYLKTQGHLPEPIDYIIATVYEDSTEWYEQLEAIAKHFIPKILGYQREDCYLSKYSSLWDFVSYQDEKVPTLLKIQCEYEIDVSDIEDGNLLRVFARILLESVIWRNIAGLDKSSHSMTV